MRGVQRADQQGFSAVELLITLFIAVAFIATGYQLYFVVIETGGESRMQAIASNIAYNNLRTYATQTTNPCTAVTPSPTPTIPANSTLTSPAISVTISCPFGSARTSKVSVSVTYDSPQKEVVRALYVTNN